MLTPGNCASVTVVAAVVVIIIATIRMIFLLSLPVFHPFALVADTFPNSPRAPGTVRCESPRVLPLFLSPSIH